MTFYILLSNFVRIGKTMSTIILLSMIFILLLLGLPPYQMKLLALANLELWVLQNQSKPICAHAQISCLLKIRGEISTISLVILHLANEFPISFVILV